MVITSLGTFIFWNIAPIIALVKSPKRIARTLPFGINKGLFSFFIKKKFSRALVRDIDFDLSYPEPMVPYLLLIQFAKAV